MNHQMSQMNPRHAWQRPLTLGFHLGLGEGCSSDLNIYLREVDWNQFWIYLDLRSSDSKKTTIQIRRKSHSSRIDFPSVNGV